MRRFNDYPIGYKLISGYVFITLILVIIGWIGISAMNEMADQTHMLYEDNTLPLTEIGTVEVALNSIRALTFRCIAIPEENEFDITRIQTEIGTIERNISLIKSTPMNSEQAETFALFLKQWDIYKGTVDQFLTHLDEGNISAGKAMIVSGGDHANARRATVSTFDKMKSLALKSAYSHNESVNTKKDQSSLRMMVLILVAVLASLSIGIILTRNITKPLFQMRTMFHNIEKGIFSGHLNMGRRDEIGKIADSFDHFTDYLENDIISRITAIGEGKWVDILSPQDEHDQITPAFNAMISAITEMEDEVISLTRSAAAGNLSMRSDLSRFRGGYREIIKGFNIALDSIINPIQEAKRLSGSYAAGNLIDHFSPGIEVQGDFKDFRDDLNYIGVGLSSVLIEILSEMEKLEEISVNVRTSIIDVSAGSQLLTKTVETVSMHAEEMQKKYFLITKDMQELSRAVESVTSRTDKVAGLSQKTNDNAKSGTHFIKNTEEEMNSIDSSVHHVELLIREINDAMGEIQSIVKLIGDISDKTNLLALNAAIEAARAGEAGLGFAVVAGEVKELANESQQSTDKVSGIITSLISQTDEVDHAMKEAVGQVSSGRNSVEKTMGLFNQMVVSIDSLSDHMTDVASASEKQAVTMQGVDLRVHEMNEIITLLRSEILNAASEAAKENEETSASFKEVSHVIETLNQSITMIKAMIDQFVLI